jgi:hypothetical protein
MSRRERWPFACSADGLFQQILLLQRKGTLDFDLRREHKFHPTRLWRFDLALTSPKIKIGVEYQGGLFMDRRGGHQTARGTRKDWEKFGEAQILGWVVLLFGPDETRSGTAMNVVERAITVLESRAR